MKLHGFIKMLEESEPLCVLDEYCDTLYEFRRGVTNAEKMAQITTGHLNAKVKSVCCHNEDGVEFIDVVLD